MEKRGKWGNVRQPTQAHLRSLPRSIRATATTRQSRNRWTSRHRASELLSPLVEEPHRPTQPCRGAAHLPPAEGTAQPKTSKKTVHARLPRRPTGDADQEGMTRPTCQVWEKTEQSGATPISQSGLYAVRLGAAGNFQFIHTLNAHWL